MLAIWSLKYSGYILRFPETKTAAGFPNRLKTFARPVATWSSFGVLKTVHKLAGVLFDGSALVADSLNIPLHCMKPEATKRWAKPPPAEHPPMYRGLLFKRRLDLT
ncbi:hypothetical protein AR158_c058L [Paramecium bursaria Chlorella virus AR158]|uniref:hypothetical protein n=1 Tax=Paramecium bursaria Chlorella virus AR158 TaxID=380598 RepID=UPI00015AA771|nr:hypothetical protein AR158_c058L [Paramecium bursaria Chlorella virus AR158]ABU43604.1 hypothetical protein AR158_c058L [Paramecium bursaria Chlorella virus AR158]